MRLPPPGRRRNPGNVATGAPGLGRISPLPRALFFDFLAASAAAAPDFFPAETESAEPGMANCCPGAGAGLGVWASAIGLHARSQAHPAHTQRREANIGTSRPRPREDRQILTWFGVGRLRRRGRGSARDGPAKRTPEIFLSFPRVRRESVGPKTEGLAYPLYGGLLRRAGKLVDLRGDEDDLGR